MHLGNVQSLIQWKGKLPLLSHKKLPSNSQSREKLDRSRYLIIMSSIISFLSAISTMEREHRSLVMLCLIVGGALLCFLTMATDSMVENTTVGEAIRNGSVFHISAAALISLAVPVYLNLMVDLYVDNFGIEAKKRKKSKTTIQANDKDILTNVEKLFLMVGLVIFPVVSCFTGWSKAILLVCCASSASVRMIVVVLPFLLHCCPLLNRCIFCRFNSLFYFMRC